MTTIVLPGICRPRMSIVDDPNAGSVELSIHNSFFLADLKPML